jgi:hypothetical protein
MTTYKELFGKAVKYLSTDPTDDIEGQIWYNSTSGTFKTQVNLGGVWSSAAPLITARALLSMGNTGTQTAGIAIGGRTNPPEVMKAETEEYDGSSWTAGGNLNQGRFSGASFGVQTAAVLAGGDRPALSPDGRTETEEYNGSSWTSGNAVPVPRARVTGFGILTAGVQFGGITGTFPFVAQDSTQEYDGTNWAGGGTLNTSRGAAGGVGSQTAGLAIAGQATSPPGSSILTTEEYNGTSWTNLTNINTGRGFFGATGTQTLAYTNNNY